MHASSAEIEVLSRKPTRQEAAITGFRALHDRHDNRHQDWAQKSRFVSKPVFCPGSRRPFLFPVVQQRSDSDSGNAVKSGGLSLGSMKSFAGLVVSGQPLTVPSFGFAAV